MPSHVLTPTPHPTHMALVPCPDCGHEISELAPTCIHCGRPMHAAAQPAAAAAPGDVPPPRWSNRAREMAQAAPADLPKPVGGIAAVLVIAGAGLVWAMLPAHPKDPTSVAAELGVVSKGVNMLGNSAAIIGAIMAAMDHRTGHRVVRVTSWLMIPAMLLLVLLGWTLLRDDPRASAAGASAMIAGIMGLAAVFATAPWLLFLYLFRKSRYG